MTVIGHFYKTGSAEVSIEGYSHVSEMWVETDDPEDTGHAVIAYLIDKGFVYGAFYNVGNDSASRSVLYQIDQPVLAPGSATVWSVTLRYRPLTPELMEHGANPNTGAPASILNRRPIISTTTKSRREPVEKAVYRGGLETTTLNSMDPPWVEGEERAVTNSAGVAIFPPLEVDLHNRVVRITRNVAAVALDETNFPLKWINSVAFTIASRNTTIPIKQYELKILGWSTQEVFQEGIDYVEVTFEGEIQKGGWRVELLDQGMMERPGYNPGGPTDYSELAEIIDRHGNPVREPVLLDGMGRKKGPGEPDALYGKWGIQNEIDPRTLGFFSGFTA